VKCYTKVYTEECVNFMPTNLAIDDKLIETARQVGRHKTKKEAVTAALSQYIARHKQLEILSLFGTIDFDPKYDYKAERRKRR
jgi:Arc/MetJ family transcription regulator